MTITPTALFAALSHDTRLRCLLLLLDHQELCVCELGQAIGAAQPHMSRHLGQLRELGLVSDRRAGQWIHYRLNPGLPDWVLAVLRDTARGNAGIAPFAADRDALAAPARGRAPRCA